MASFYLFDNCLCSSLQVGLKGFDVFIDRPVGKDCQIFDAGINPDDWMGFLKGPVGYLAGNAYKIIIRGWLGYRGKQNPAFDFPVEGDPDSLFEFWDAQFSVLDGYRLGNSEELRELISRSQSKPSSFFNRVRSFALS